MMEKIMLGFLFLLDCVVLSTCILPQYYFVNQLMNWNEAQTYCRQKHTDLATILNSKEQNQFYDNLTSAGHSSDVWIGLFSEINWKWSDGYIGSGADYRNWHINQPSWHYVDDLCVGLFSSGSWFDDVCTDNRPFLCYQGSHLDPEFVHVKTPMNWSNAQIHCRENFIDLATIKNDTQEQQVQSLKPDADEAWIGLYRDPDHHWSDGRSVLFTHWDSTFIQIALRTVICGATSTGRSGRWKLLPSERRLPFVCYDTNGGKVSSPDNVTTDEGIQSQSKVFAKELKGIRKQVVKLRLHFEDPEAMEDPVQKGKILTEAVQSQRKELNPNRRFVHSLWQVTPREFREKSRVDANQRQEATVSMRENPEPKSKQNQVNTPEDQRAEEVPEEIPSRGLDGQVLFIKLIPTFFKELEPGGGQPRIPSLETTPETFSLWTPVRGIFSLPLRTSEALDLRTIKALLPELTCLSTLTHHHLISPTGPAPFARTTGHHPPMTDAKKPSLSILTTLPAGLHSRGLRLGENPKEKPVVAEEPRMLEPGELEAVVELQQSPQSSIVMGKIMLGLLFLLDWVVLCTCILPQYHFVNKLFTWTEAQTYCRQKHTDLASILNSEQQNQLIDNLTSAGHSSDVWIGLFNEIDWRWSDGFSGSGADYRSWTPSNNEPNFTSGSTQLEPEYVYVAESRTWTDAQKYCREFFIDLATVRDNTENQMALTLIPSGEEPWIGLSRSSNSFQWSDGSPFLFFNPDGIYNPLGSMKVICGATSTMRSGKYKFLPCETKLPFVCYSVQHGECSTDVTELTILQ
ncbi:uncharacterized protein LOC119772132 [Cyprinodon tularosa]|uniref:uncharacterized protein LOC119772132 n=1 Tax=Cyprinodon tularosa TaxID=77115 RepID=UPI0018E27044|nr:uncharacterized protein LOC119772132 [Cyprinodon tularosa]